ncbi:hypothetical protein [Thiohalobacter sp.]|uniref:hypothetical protein n=1 Tax=Thiohalobacter sp. TaxID=2025948 RepID=UPI00262E3254|nr:hypothetical protein [Thiohalobacter sp.]
MANSAPDIDVPKWDLALAGLARETSQQQGRALNLEDFRALAREHAIRLDDIMVTLFQLVIHGEWEYRDASGQRQALDQDTLDGLYVNRRLTEEDLAAFTGSWQPLG